MQPIVSIILPAYNAVETIARAVNSCRAQTYRDIEIIIVDDGSTDDTETVVKELLEADPRIRCYQKNNGGVSSARNYGLSRANGDYIVFLDSDDCLFPNAITDMLALQEMAPEAVVMTKLKRGPYEETAFEEAAALPSLRQTVISKDRILRTFGLRLYDEQSACGKLFVRAVILENSITFDASIANGEDGLFVFSYLTHFDRIIFSSDCRFYYAIRRQDSSTRSAYSHKYFTAIEAAEKMLPYCADSKRAVIRIRSYTAYRANEVVIKIYEEPSPLQYRSDIHAAKKTMRKYLPYYLLDPAYSKKSKLFYLVWAYAADPVLERIVKRRRSRQRSGVQLD